MLPLMFAARKLDGEDPNIIFMLRCSYFTVQFFIVLAVLYVYLVSKKLAQSKFKDTVIYVPPPPQPLADPNAKPQYKQSTFGQQATSTAFSLLSSTLFGICMTTALHWYKGMIVGLAMQSVMGPLNLLENKMAKAILLGGSFKAGDTPKSRKIFGEKYREELTKDDEVVDAEGKVIVLKTEESTAATTTAAGKKKKDSSSSFEDLLLDTWDEGEKANVQPLLKALNSSNANFKTSENGWTPLMIAAALGAEKCDLVIQKLKELGANANVVDVEGWNALHWAAFHGSASGAKCLLDVYGVAEGLQDVKDKEGKTPLQHAKDEKNDDVVKVLEEMSVAASLGVGKGLAEKDGLRKRK